MRFKSYALASLAVVILATTPALAKRQAANGKGVFCSQGGDNAFIPAAHFSANVRNHLVKGQKVKVNLAGYGMVNCTVY